MIGGFSTNCFLSQGLSDELIQKGKDIKSISEIEENGNNFKVTVTTGSKVLVNTFTIGQEAELETVTGEKVKVSQHTQFSVCRTNKCMQTSTLLLNPLAHWSIIA